MANADHLNIVKKGVGEWNEWRENNPELIPDLSWASLMGLELDEALFRESNLKLAFCKDCSFVNADFFNANLYGTNFESSNLSNANLENANLEGAHLINAYLMGINLTGANLKLANLDGSILTGANLIGVKNIKVNQLLKVKTLKNCKLDGILFEKIREVSPELFE